jgi:hypothetical protein
MNALKKHCLDNIDSLIAACVGFYVIYIFTSYSGVGISPDSIMYASTATNIREHGSLLTFNKHPLTFFPVFYPFFLGIIELITGIDPIKAGSWVDCSLFAGVIFTTGWIISGFQSRARLWSWSSLQRFKYLRGWRIVILIALILVIDYLVAAHFTYKAVIPDNILWLRLTFPIGSTGCWFLVIFFIELAVVAVSSSYKRLILAAIILSPALLEVYTYLWSETLFIFEVLLFIVAYHRYLQSHKLTALLGVAIVTAIACITRYVGITIIGAGGLLLLLDNELPWKKKIGHILFFGAISACLLATNLIINSQATGLSTGTREPSITPFSQNLYYFGTVVCDWGALSSNTYPYAILIGSVIFVALSGVLLFKTINGRINRYENIVIAFAIVYGLFIVVWASFQRFERINSRLFSPMFIPLLIACTSWAPDVLKLIRSKVRYLLAGIAVLLMLAFEDATYKVDWQRHDDEDDYGVPGYSDDDWNKSEFVVYLKQHKNIYKPGIPIYTDADEAVYLFTGLSSTLVPHKFFKADVQKFYGVKHFYLVWFNTLSNTEILSLQDIMKNKKLTQIGGTKEGEIFLCQEP